MRMFLREETPGKVRRFADADADIFYNDVLPRFFGKT